ncbi:MAG: type II toxin-antitoxin system prevent-host-death family antitoxin [Treponema sp.]|nr:type II toxin-antitoxin system prevent-host-death family antitoxin [Treponema sp.]
METLTIALTKPKVEWQLQEAKAMFSEVVKSAVFQPQFITVRGKKTAVVLSFDEYRKLSSPKTNLFEFIQNSPLRNIELELPVREIEIPREVNL